MGIKKEELERIMDYLSSENYEIRDWKLNGKTTIADKTMISDEGLEVYSFIHVFEGERLISVHASIGVRHLNYKKTGDKLGLSIEIHSLEQIKKVESKAEELLEMVKKLDVWE